MADVHDKRKTITATVTDSTPGVRVSSRLQWYRYCATKPCSRQSLCWLRAFGSPTTGL